MAHDPGETAPPNRSSMMALVIVACIAIALIALLSPRWRDVREEPVARVGESVAPGPVPSLDRRPAPQP